MDESNSPRIIGVNAGNVDRTGFFCYMSKPKSEGFQRKLAWLKARFAEGMHIKMLELPLRGFIEYIPGEYAWRAVNAPGYMVIHCLWVVGKSKSKGYAGLLIEECLRDAERAGMRGVAMVTSERIWLAGKKILLKHGFESVGEAPPFNLMIKKFDSGALPSFPEDWGQRARHFGSGLTVVRSDQCPYIPDATELVLETARQHQIPARVFELKSSQEIRDLSPSPYGVFAIVLDSRLLAYHYLMPKDLQELLKERG